MTFILTGNRVSLILNVFTLPLQWCLEHSGFCSIDFISFNTPAIQQMDTMKPTVASWGVKEINGYFSKINFLCKILKNRHPVTAFPLPPLHALVCIRGRDLHLLSPRRAEIS